MKKISCLLLLLTALITVMLTGCSGSSSYGSLKQ